MNLESRARRAAASLQASVAGVAAPAAGAARAPSRRRLIAGLAFGGALAAALLVVGLLVIPSGEAPQPLAGTDTSSTTTVAAGASGLDGATTLPPTTTLPPEGSGSLPDPMGGGGTTTTAAPTTTTTPDDSGSTPPPGPDNSGSEGDQSDLLPGFWASQAYGCSAEEAPVELFYGGSEPGDVITIDSSYGSTEVLVGADGYWEASLAFVGAPYDEPFPVTITDGAGEAWDLTFVVTDPADGDCAPPVEYWFSANQLWGCSVEEPPSDLFYGDGVPGDVITLESPYGSATAVVDESGWWEATLTFAGAPIGETFLVTATSGSGEVWELWFTAADPETGECFPPEEYWFSAYQGSGCSLDAPPTEYFYGTGFPGDVIGIESPYGSAEAVVDEWGWWEATLTFDGAPYDEPFEVTVTAPDGEVWAFSFLAPDPATGSCWLFTAYQGAGCSVEQPPSDWFWGTGAPGGVVKLTSPYGSAEAVIDEWGYWEATLTFTGAPVGEAFTIEVAGPDDTVWAFPFIVADPEEGTCWGSVEPCPPDGCDGGPAPWPLPGDQSPAYVESVEFLTTAGNPALVSVVVEGWLPTPCHALAWELTDVAGALTLDLYSLADPTGACIQVLAPFTEAIDLGAFSPGSYLLYVNGQGYPFEV